MSMKKSSSLTALALGHVAQNILSEGVLRSKRFSKSVADYAYMGFHGKEPVLKQKLKHSILGGAILPDARTTQLEAHRAGMDLRKEIGGDVTKRDMALLRAVTQGRLQHASKMIYHAPNGQKILDAVEKKVGFRVGGLVHHAKDSVALKRFESEWKSKRNPLSSNVLSNITKPSIKDLHKLPDYKHKAHGTFASVASAGAMALAEPGVGALNVGKTALLSPEAQKNKYIKKISDKLITKFTTNPAKDAFKNGAEGKPLSKAKSFVNKYLTNNMSGNLEQLGHNLGSSLNPKNKIAG